jgi:ribosome biogenesis protein BRX1
MDELKMTGNCMRGSRPVLSFDKSFDAVDHLRVVKHLLVDVFGTPRGHPKSKPFVDRVMGFYYADGKVRRRTRRAGHMARMCP